MKIPPLPAERTGRRTGAFIGAFVTILLSLTMSGVAVALSPTLIPLAWYLGQRIGRANHFRRKLHGSMAEIYIAYMDEIDQECMMEVAATKSKTKSPALQRIAERRQARIGALNRDLQAKQGPFAVQGRSADPQLQLPAGSSDQQRDREHPREHPRYEEELNRRRALYGR